MIFASVWCIGQAEPNSISQCLGLTFFIQIHREPGLGRSFLFKIPKTGPSRDFGGKFKELS